MSSDPWFGDPFPEPIPCDPFPLRDEQPGSPKSPLIALSSSKKGACPLPVCIPSTSSSTCSSCWIGFPSSSVISTRNAMNTRSAAVERESENGPITVDAAIRAWSNAATMDRDSTFVPPNDNRGSSVIARPDVSTSFTRTSTPRMCRWRA